MALSLNFTKLVLYDPGEPGVSVGVEVRMADRSLSFDAEIDTGSTLCVFERRIGKILGIDIEIGKPMNITTATGTFRAFGHDAR